MIEVSWEINSVEVRLKLNHHAELGNMSSRFKSSYEAFASNLLENLEDMFICWSVGGEQMTS